jgi:hypothetical protein
MLHNTSSHMVFKISKDHQGECKFPYGTMSWATVLPAQVGDLVSHFCWSLPLSDHL